MKKLAKLAAVLVLAAPFAAAAENALPRQVDGMECMVGKWQGKGSVVMGKDTAPIEATWDCDRTSARYGVLCTFRVTGIPATEAQALRSRTDYAEYQRTTSEFVPLPPRRGH